MFFKIDKQDITSKARAGIIQTKHSTIKTPIFMPVGTRGSVKSVHQRELQNDIKASIILGNTYHLYSRPGIDIIKQAGGIHKFIGWDKSVLTDSGGYQVYSLAKTRNISEEGVCFRSHIDGAKHLFTPESAIDIQRAIGADIIMAFDECTPSQCSFNYAKKSMDMTHRWLKRCCKRFDLTVSNDNKYQNLFPIVQGSIYKDLRKQSAEFITEQNRFGNAIGGVCHPTGHLYEITDFVCDILPKNKPRYLMGVGTPKDILECIELGVDMFDCVMPTRDGRNGRLYTTKGIINIRNNKWKKEFKPIDNDLGGYVSTHYTKGYLNHLFNVNEILACQIASIQNLRFYLWLVSEARKEIIKDNFRNWKKSILSTIMNKI